MNWNFSSDELWTAFTTWSQWVNSPECFTHSPDRDLVFARNLCRAIGRTQDHARDLVQVLNELLSQERWYTRYERHIAERRAIYTIRDTQQFQRLLKAVENGEIGVVVYYRALDRAPGGNRSTLVIKYTLCPEWTLRMDYIFNDDSTIRRTHKSIELPSPSRDQMEAAFYLPLEKWLNTENYAQNVQTTRVDPQFDEETWDSEWSSVEALVYAPKMQLLYDDMDVAWESDPDFNPKRRWVLVARIHQRALCPRWDAKDREVTANEPRGAHARLLDGLHALSGVGRPKQFVLGQAPMDHTLKNMRKKRTYEPIGIYAPLCRLPYDVRSL